MNGAHAWCAFHAADATFGVAVDRVQEIVREAAIARTPTAPTAIAGLMNLRGRLVPVIDLRTLFARPARDPEAATFHVIVRDGDDHVSLLVDRIVGVHRAPDGVLEPLSEAIGEPHTALVTGVRPQGDDMLLVLDLDALFDHAFRSHVLR